MSTNDFFSPPQLHTRGDLADLASLLEAKSAKSKRAAMLAQRQRLAQAAAKRAPHKMSERDKRAAVKIKNPLYSKALGADGLNDGNQNRSQNGVPPHQGLISNLPGSQSFTGLGSGEP